MAKQGRMVSYRLAAAPRGRPAASPAAQGAAAASVGRLSPERYTAEVLAGIERRLRERVTRLAASGTLLPSPQELADLLGSNLPDTPTELDPHFADLGPFYASDGAMRQLGGLTKQALDSRRRTQTVLAMQAGDGTWLYPAWQFDGLGSIHRALTPVLKALRSVDRWQAGVWLVAEHPDLGGVSPRHALRDGVAPADVARVAEHDRQRLVA